MQRNTHHELELENEFEDEFENETQGEGAHEFEDELSHELGAEGEDEGLFGEGESAHEAYPEGELEEELAHEFESELAHESEGEDELLFGEGEGEEEFAHEAGFGEGEGEGEEFFGRAFRSIGRFVKNNAGTFKAIGRIAAPLVAKAVGGALGGPAGAMIGGKLGNFVAGQLKEMELGFAGESAHESHEAGHEGELEAHEITPVGQHEALGELFAQRAALAHTEAEAEAFIGAATTSTITRRERVAMRRVLADMVAGAAVLTRVLRLRRSTRPAVRLVPDIVRRTTRSLVRCAASGRPVTRRLAARVMAAQTRRVLGSPRYAANVMRRSLTRVRSLHGGGGGGYPWPNGMARRRAAYRY